MLPDEVLAYVVSALPPPPARVLEVGAGSGELARALAALGYELVAIDPAAEHEPVQPVALADLREEPRSFDAAVAIVSLHHVEPLAGSLERLAEVLRPGAPLVVDEFDVSSLDERAAQWWIAQRRAAGGEPAHTAAEMVAMLRGHLHGLGEIRAALEPWFTAGEPVRGAYLYRFDLHPAIRAVEERAIAELRMPATGARLVAVRRPPGATLGGVPHR